MRRVLLGTAHFALYCMQVRQWRRAHTNSCFLTINLYLFRNHLYVIDNQVRCFVVMNDYGLPFVPSPRRPSPFSALCSSPQPVPLRAAPFSLLPSYTAFLKQRRQYYLQLGLRQDVEIERREATSPRVGN